MSLVDLHPRDREQGSYQIWRCDVCRQAFKWWLRHDTKSYTPAEWALVARHGARPRDERSRGQLCPARAVLDEGELQAAFLTGGANAVAEILAAWGNWRGYL